MGAPTISPCGSQPKRAPEDCASRCRSSSQGHGRCRPYQSTNERFAASSSATCCPPTWPPTQSHDGSSTVPQQRSSRRARCEITLDTPVELHLGFSVQAITSDDRAILLGTA